MRAVRNTLLILFMVSALLLAGCENGGDDQTAPSTTTPFIGGKNALSASYVEGSPPSQTFDDGNSAFSISVRLENLGEATVEPADGFVEIVGINPVDFGLPGQNALKKSFPNIIQRARKASDGTIIDGGESVVTFEDLRYIPDLAGNTQVSIRSDICYDYTTRTSTKICIKENLLEVGDNVEICSVSGDKDPQNSGAPIHITSLSQSPLGQEKIQVTFEVAHVGDSQDSFFAVGAPECRDRVTNPDRYKVHLKVTSDVNGVKPRCTNLENRVSDSEGDIKLYDKSPRTVICQIDLTHIESDFEELFEVELSYRYLQRIEKQLEIRDVSQI